jgi:hypothetical protein
MKRLWTVLAGVIAMLVVSGVAIEDFSGSNGTPSIQVTDTPVSGISHIYLNVSSIELQGGGNSSVSFPVKDGSFDLLSLVNVTMLLGTSQVPVGNYTMIRFNITSAVATIGGTNSSLTVPSGQVKVPLLFSVSAGKTTTVVLDVTADMTNISASGNLRPVAVVKSITGPS